MQPPHEVIDQALLEVGEAMIEFLDRGEGGSVPCWVYVYDPKHEYSVRSEMVRLATWLHSPERAVALHDVSLAEVFWEAIDETGMYDELIAQEREAADDPALQSEVHRAVGQLLRLPPTLTERVASMLPDPGGRDAGVLHRAGALYPNYRISALLDDLKLRTGVRIPLLLLYPGRIEGDYGLSFMGVTEPAYGYRAMIVARGERRGKS